MDTWPYEDGTGDPWWQGGISPKYYTWQLELSISPQTHSSHLTRQPYEYSGYDINVGDWISNNNSGLSLQIISVERKTRTSATVIVEDIMRYNTFRDPGGSGDGALGVGQAIIFGLNEEGMPGLDPIVPSGVSKTFYANISSRFLSFNDQFFFNLTEEGHSFEIGDIVAADSSTNSFVLADQTNSRVVGEVVMIGPTPNDFYVLPPQKVKDDFDYLVGDKCDDLYIDGSSPGKLTLSSSSKKIVYVKLRNNTLSYNVGTVINPSTTAGYTFELNNELIVVSGTGTIADITNDINAIQSITGVSASSQPVPNEMRTAVSSLFYGQPGLYTSTSPTAIINGITVVFDINTQGLLETGLNIAVEEDMVEAINRDMLGAGNTDIVADVVSSNAIRIQSLNGNALTITNGTTDANGVGFAGGNSGSGLPLSVSSVSGVNLRLEADDARSIELRNISGTVLEDFGIFSCENGQKAAALTVEQTLREASLLVVGDIPGRDALSPLIGDQVFVVDSGNGEWAQYLWDGSSWVVIATQDSAKTDADTIHLLLNYTYSSNTYEIGKISNNSRITLITVVVNNSFDGSPTLTIGDVGDNERLMDNEIHDLSATGTYVIHSDHLYDTGSDVSINAYFDPGGSSQGDIEIILSYQ
jgi:hypothetical protein